MTWELRHCDNLDPVCGLPSLADKSVDHVICDPPYSEHTHARTWQAKTLGRPTVYGGIDFDAVSAEGACAFMAEAARVVRRWVIVFSDVEATPLWRRATEEAGMDYVRACAWVKPDATPQFTGDRPASGFEMFVVSHPKGKKRWNGGGRRNVYTCMRAPGGAPHPTCKPLALMESLIRDFTDPGELILDPYAGSGTTGVAAVRLGRRFIGMERDEKYADIARRRIDATREQGELFAAMEGA